MTYLFDLLNTPLADAVGFALLHFIWQGALIAGMLALGLWVLRHHTPALRYNLALAALLLMALLPVWTTIQLYEPTAFTQTAPASSSGPASELLAPQSQTPAAYNTAPEVADVSYQHTLQSFFANTSSVIVLIWMLGVVFFAVRFAGGLYLIARIRRNSSPLDQPDILYAFRAMQNRIGVASHVGVRISAHIHAPLLIGWLKPMILLPASMLTGYSTAQVESILAHELAHVRRHDYLISVVQTCIETVLFYHPAVWWVSKQIRIEREQCCDDLAVAASANKLVYLQALSQLETQRMTLALGAGDGELIARIKRLVEPAAIASKGQSTAALMLMVFLASSMLFAACKDAPSMMEESVEAQTLILPPDLRQMVAANDIAGTITRLHEIRESGDEDALAIAEAVYYAAEQEDLRRNLMYVFAHFNTPAADEFLLQVVERDEVVQVKQFALRAFSVRVHFPRAKSTVMPAYNIEGYLNYLSEYPTITQTQIETILTPLKGIVSNERHDVSIRSLALGLIGITNADQAFIQNIAQQTMPDLLRVTAYRYHENASEAVDGLINIADTSTDEVAAMQARISIADVATFAEFPTLFEKYANEAKAHSTIFYSQSILNTLYNKLSPGERISVHPEIRALRDELGPDHPQAEFLQRLLTRYQY